MFDKFIVDIKTNNLFQKLERSAVFENVTVGRKAAILVDNSETIPLVRSTTNYAQPPQLLSPIHTKLMELIKQTYKCSAVQFNNTMMEIYTSDYCKMGFHSDQSLDLADDSHICIFSCYERNPDRKTEIRKLIVKNKDTKVTSEIVLDDNSAVIFSTHTNAQYQHKIVLQTNKKTSNRWLGITFRLSKRFVKFDENVPYLIPNNCILKIANKDQITYFFQLKALENGTLSKFHYPEIDFTISDSDIMSIVPITRTVQHNHLCSY